MSRKPREEEILNILKEKNYVTVDYLSGKIHISPSSIRRDLTKLEQKGYIKRTHGGASLVSSEPGAAPFPFRLHAFKKEKQSIAKTASALLKKESAVFLDSSTLSFQMHPYITTELGLTIFTNNIYLAQLLAARNISTYCVGGNVKTQNSVVTTGQFALEMLNSIYVDQMFFASSALSESGMITDLNEPETTVRRLMLSHTKKSVFLHHQERFGHTSKFLVTDLSSIDCIVSDSTFEKSFTEKFQDTEFKTADD